MIAKEEARQRIADLVVRFREQYAAYKRSEYSEALVRKDFIDPFFKALGWDMDNAQGFAEAYREVIHEDKVKVQKSLKAPDYSFRLPGGKRLFFVEAKKPFVKVKTEIEPAYQVRRYAWSAKLPVSILTDFEEFSVYDCTKRPRPEDGASMARVKYLTYEQYAEEFDFLWNTFSKEQVLKGSFDKFVASDRQKRGTSTVDAAFLDSLDEWRKYLATNISINNKTLGEDELNHCVQQTIDRLIFLRIAEDRGVEEYGRMKDAVTEGGDVYRNLFSQFHLADGKYNSGLFDFKKDKLSATLKVDAKVIRRVIEELYYPKCPYEFSVISVEILGSAYEQFLGKRIVVGKGHVARIEEKPEVRKAGGVYYTPQYIVDHIVERTVGELVRGKTPEQVAKLRILDPACGSGSFLLGAYRYLLNWHKAYYGALKKPTKGRKEDVLRPDGELTSAVKKAVLLNNIHGVDLDANAVEVTKLSLLLKCMEGETGASVQFSLDLHHERLLPTLDSNVLCGNSLVDTDFYNAPHAEEDVRRLKPFSWVRAFERVLVPQRSTMSGQEKIEEHLRKAGQVLKRLKEEGEEILRKHGDGTVSEPLVHYGDGGGFDAVIGNPPYVRPHNISAVEKEYLWGRYNTFTHKSDLYCCFFQQAVALLRPGGRFGYIVSDGWLRLHSFQALRRMILEAFVVEEVIELPFRVFESADVKTGMVIFSKGQARAKHELDVVRGRLEEGRPVFEVVNRIPQALFNKTFQHVFDLSISPATERIKERMRAGARIGELFNVQFGLKTADDARFVHGTKGLHAEDKPLLRGDDIKRYHYNYKGEYVWYVPDRMRRNKSTARPGEPARFEQAKVLVKDTTTDFGAMYDDAHYYVKDVLVLTPMPGAGPIDLLALTGILNSTLMKFYYRTTFPTLHVQAEEVRSLPLPLFRTPAATVAKDLAGLATMVKEMIASHRELNSANAPSVVDRLRARVAHQDARIDAAVFALFGLTQEEIALVQDKAAGA